MYILERLMREKDYNYVKKVTQKTHQRYKICIIIIIITITAIANTITRFVGPKIDAEVVLSGYHTGPYSQQFSQTLSTFLTPMFMHQKCSFFFRRPLSVTFQYSFPILDIVVSSCKQTKKSSICVYFPIYIYFPLRIS